MNYKSFLLVFAICILLISCKNEEVEHVKQQHLPYCESSTLDNLIKAVLDEPKWFLDNDVNDNMFVSAYGKLLTGDHASVSFRFKISNGPEAEILGYEVNDRFQEPRLAYRHFVSFCSDDYKNHFVDGAVGSLKKVGGFLKGLKDEASQFYKANEEEIDSLAGAVKNGALAVGKTAADVAKHLYEENKDDIKAAGKYAADKAVDVYEKNKDDVKEIGSLAKNKTEELYERNKDDINDVKDSLARMTVKTAGKVVEEVLK